MKVMFVTYSAANGQLGDVAFMGVLKRCIRLIGAMPESDIEFFLVNFGEVPMNDPRVAEVVSQISAVPDALIPDPGHFDKLFDWIKPDVIVLGEGPCAGSMRAISKEARSYGIPQIAVENFYSLGWSRLLKQTSPTIDQWLLLGLPHGHEYGRINAHLTLAPPLIAKPRPAEEDDDPTDVTILGYDVNVVQSGLNLLRELPSGTKTRLISARDDLASLDEWKRLGSRRPIEVVGLPDEETLATWLATSKIVIAKNGYQQIVESLALGTPVVLHSAPGGVGAFMLSSEVRSLALYIPDKFTFRSRRKFKSQMRSWIKSKPQNPWTGELAGIPDLRTYASRQLLDLLNSTAGAS